MAHRRLTKGCLHAMRAAAASPAIFNRTVADNLRVVARIYPKFVILTCDARRAHSCREDATPLLRANLTPQGRDFITPRKTRHHEARP